MITALFAYKSYSFLKVTAMQMGEVGGPSMDPIVDSEHGLDMEASFWQQLKATVVRNILRKKRNKRQAFRVKGYL